jgi:hypothetical protein
MERVVIAIAAGKNNNAKFHGEFLGRLKNYFIRGTAQGRARVAANPGMFGNSGANHPGHRRGSLLHQARGMKFLPAIGVSMTTLASHP